MEEEYFSESELDLDELALLEANLVILENTKAEKELQEKLKKEGVEISTSVVEEELHPVIMYLIQTFPYLQEEASLKFLKTRQNLTNIASFVEALDLIYPGSWSPQHLVQHGLDNLFFVIHFPKTVITNSKNQTHTIEDLYVRIGVNGPECNFNGIIQGVRGTMTGKELSYNSDSYTYEHSHLSTSKSNLGKFTGFCLGSSELASLTNNYAGKSNITVEQATKYVLLIISLVNWESLEGSPYRYIGEIGINRNADNPIIRSLLNAYRGQYRSHNCYMHFELLDMLVNQYDFDLNSILDFRGITSNNKLNVSLKSNYVDILLDFCFNVENKIPDFLLSRCFCFTTDYDPNITNINFNFSRRHFEDIKFKILESQERLLLDKYEENSKTITEVTEIISEKITEIEFFGKKIPVVQKQQGDEDLTETVNHLKEADLVISKLALTMPSSTRREFEVMVMRVIHKVHLIKLKNYESSK